jgi:ATP-dependent RNA helicase DHX8/PRP22
MDELQKLQELSLVSKICTELENHLGFNDKDMAEFIIKLAEKNNTFESFKSVLIENKAQFNDSFIANLLRIIQHMKPKVNTISNETEKENDFKSVDKNDIQMKKALFPFLALPNDPNVRLMLDSDHQLDSKTTDLNTETVVTEDQMVANDAMAFLESLAPKTGHEIDSNDNKLKRSPNESIEKSRKKSRNRSRSRDRDRSKTSRSHRSRDRSRDRNRSKSNDRFRDRSRSHDRSRDRRRHRSRSHDRDR